ncbi:MAG TPA: MMPL family transporter [Candidatus Limnocylindria bacterium]|nr:MMPL family transporter [Candidatus Limnocylindria bacterium]
MLTTLFARYARWLLRHRLLVTVAVLLVTAGLVRFAGRLYVEVDPDKQVPSGHPYIVTLGDVYRIFGDKNLVVVGLFPRDGQVFTPAFLAKLDEITRRLATVPGANTALMQSIAAANTKDVTGTVEQIEVSRVMPALPATQAEADEVRRRVHANPAFIGTLVTADDSAAAVQASFELTPATPDYRSLHQAIVAELEAASDGTFDYKLAGLVVLLSELSHYAAKMAYVFPVALLVIALVHFDAFRTFQGLVLPMVTALLAVLWAIGLMGLFGIPLDPLNTTTPILILAVAAGHAVQVLKRFYEEYEKIGEVDEAIVSCISHVGPVMVGAGLVATLSFWSLVTFQTASIRTFGLFAGLGIASALAIEMTIIPVVRSLLPAPPARERRRQAAHHPVFDPLLGWAGRVAGHRHAWLLAAVAALVVVFGWYAEHVEVKTSLRSKFRATDTIHADDEAINGRFAGTNTLVLLVEGPGEGSLEDPRILQAIDGVQAMLASKPAVGKVFSYVDVVKRLHQAFTADDPAAPAMPDSKALVAQYLFMHSMSGGGDMLDSILDPSHQVAKVRVLSREDDTAIGETLIAETAALAARTFPPGYTVRFTGTLASTAAATEVMVSGKIRNIIQVGVITFLVSALLLRSLTGGLLVVVPLVLTVIVSFGTMGMLGVPLDTMTAAISAMAIGIGADYAMYVLSRVREEVARSGDLDRGVAEAIRTSGKAVLFVSSAVAVGYATLALTGFSMHVYLGSLVALAMIVSSLSAIVVLPQLVVWLRPAFLVAAAGRREAAASGTPTPDAVRTAIVFADPEPAPLAAMQPVARELDA